MYNGILTIGPNGFGVNFPTASPRLQLSMTVTAPPTNLGPVYVGPSATVITPTTLMPPGPPGYKLVPGGPSVTIPTSAPEGYWLSGNPGDSINYTGV